MTAKRSTGKIAIFSELAWWPVGWVLLFDGELSEPLLDITGWVNFCYNTSVSATLGLPCHWIEGKYPLDFRNPEEVREGLLNQEAFLASRESKSAEGKTSES